MGKNELSARERIIETASRLFYAEGVRAVGIDRIIAEADVAKMTLYNHFQSKDDLILATLQQREECVTDFFVTEMNRGCRKGLDRLDAFFAALKKWFKGKEFRGCAFVNASVELADRKHAASKFSTDHKQRFRDLLTEIVTEAAGAKADSMVPAIYLLVEGAITKAVMDGDVGAADIARDAAKVLLPKRRFVKN